MLRNNADLKSHCLYELRDALTSILLSVVRSILRHSNLDVVNSKSSSTIFHNVIKHLFSFRYRRAEIKTAALREQPFAFNKFRIEVSNYFLSFNI